MNFGRVSRINVCVKDPFIHEIENGKVKRKDKTKNNFVGRVIFWREA